MLFVVGGLVLMGTGSGLVVVVGAALWILGSLVIGRLFAFIAARQGELGEATIADYAWQLSNHLLPFFHAHRLPQISVAEVDRYREFKVRERVLSAESINKTITRLGQILAVAEERDLIILRDRTRGNPLQVAASARRRGSAGSRAHAGRDRGSRGGRADDGVRQPVGEHSGSHARAARAQTPVSELRPVGVRRCTTGRFAQPPRVLAPGIENAEAGRGTS
jgi:hypothetical protein